METIHDVRLEQGNPRAGEPVGAPLPVTNQFGGASALHFGALILFIIGAVLVALGVCTLVFPIAIVGMLVWLASGLVWLRARSRTVL